MRINIQKLQEGFIQKKPSEGIDQIKVQENMQSFYGQSPKYLSESGNNFEAVKDQVEKMCLEMEAIGLKNFGSLRSKFEVKPNKSDMPMLNLIKESMEAIVYQTKNGTLSKEDVVNKFSDRDFICKDGTLTNLQTILSEMTLGQQGIEAFVVEQKDAMVTQMITEMYRQGEFKEYPTVFRLYKPMEIHNITSLKNAVAPQYGLLSKSKSEDRYIREVKGSSKQKMLDSLFDKFNTPEVAETFIDSIAMNMSSNIPYFETGMDPNAYSNTLIESVKNLGIGKHLEHGSLMNYDGYMAQDIKEHMHEIIKDAVILELHEQGVIENPDIEKVKLRLKIEASMDTDVASNALSSEVLELAEQKNLKEYALKYTIDKGIKLDEDDFGMSDPAQYCLENKIKINGQDARDYALDSIIDQYLKENDPEKKEKLNKRYEELQKIGQDKAPELLTLDSNIGKLLSKEDASKMLAEFKQTAGQNLEEQFDYKKCSLPLIEKCKEVAEKSNIEQVRDYSKLSLKQKIKAAVSFVLGGVGAVFSVIHSRKENMQKLSERETRIANVYSGIEKDLEKISKNNQKAADPKERAKEIGKKAKNNIESSSGLPSGVANIAEQKGGHAR